MARRLYVYYRVPAAGLAALQAEVAALQAGLMAAYPGLQAELLRRPALREGEQEVTVMEAYAGGDVTAWLAALDKAVACRPALPRPRHAEAFDTL
jgi:hypothetical protein